MAANTNSPKANLEADIRASAELINKFRDILRDSRDPKEQARTERDIEEQTTIIQGYIQQYVRMCHGLDIAQLIFFLGIDISQKADTSGVLVPAPPESAFNPNQVDRRKLREEMVKVYPQPDFELLCLDLGKRYDLLRGSTLALKIAYLVEDTHDPLRYAELVQKVITDHPHLKERLI
jgi:hypothetical protein